MCSVASHQACNALRRYFRQFFFLQSSYISATLLRFLEWTTDLSSVTFPVSRSGLCLANVQIQRLFLFTVYLLLCLKSFFSAASPISTTASASEEVTLKLSCKMLLSCLEGANQPQILFPLCLTFGWISFWQQPSFTLWLTCIRYRNLNHWKIFLYWFLFISTFLSLILVLSC